MDFASRRLQWLLRLNACVLFLALVAVFLPSPWMIRANASLGLAPLTTTPLTEYLTRSLSALYALHGLMHLLTATDVVRYRPIIRWMAAATIAFGAVVWGIDFLAGMPWWWTLAEGPGIMLIAGLILWMSRW